MDIADFHFLSSFRFQPKKFIDIAGIDLTFVPDISDCLILFSLTQKYTDRSLLQNNIPEIKEWQDQVHNGDEFTGRLLPIGNVKLAEITNSTGCARLGIVEHPLIKPRTPQTNDRVEQLNKWIADVLQNALIDSRHCYAMSSYNQYLP